MSFREFTANILSTRDYEDTSLDATVINKIKEYLEDINVGPGKDKGFSLVMLENGDEVFHSLEGIGGYSGIMIRSPHYIALTIMKENPECEFYGAYYMQSLVKRLYEKNLGSCWINARGIPYDIKSRLIKDHENTVKYLLAFGLPNEKAIKRKLPKTTFSDQARYSIGEIVYLYEWGKKASFEELEKRGLTEIFYYVRNAPSYKNLQPCRIILKDEETELAILHSEEAGAYTDAGIMMYTLEGLAKDLGIPGEWHFVEDESEGKEYRIAAKIKL